jgi:regulator of protease activity HflC (stomatin/prohibitin superfamily)
MFSFAKFGPMEYVIHYSDGKVRREGRGLSFFYWVPTSTIVAVPVGSADLPFVFNQVTRDFQTVTIQGQLTYRVAEPRRLAEALDFTVARLGGWKTNDPEKLTQRLINQAQTSSSTLIAQLSLRDALRAAPQITAAIMDGLRTSTAIQTLGVEPLSVSIVAISPTPEMARALEAEAREALQQEADMAIYSRRNNAVAEERKIRESELNTEIAVEGKKREIRETQMRTDIAVEEHRRELVTAQAENERTAAEARAFAIQATLEPLKAVDWRTLTALTQGGSDSRLAIAQAFRELAENASKIGVLNITPDLLDNLVRESE